MRSDLSAIAMAPTDYNITPSSFQPVIRESRDDGSREMVLMRWGLIPFFTKDASTVKKTFNAKAETLHVRPTWREPFKKRRCLVPLSFFYEWKTIDGAKQPFAIRLSGNSMFALAGLWDAWKDGDGHWLQSFSIVTTFPNELLAPFHDRMPAILRARDYDRWLSRDASEPPPSDLLRPFNSDEMEMSPANPLVGNVKNNGPEMLHSA